MLTRIPFCFLLLACFYLLSWDPITAKPIVDTSFQADGRDGKPETGSPKKAPLEKPTQLQVDPPSLLTVGTEPIGELASPYAVLEVKPREGKEDAPANVRIIWDMRALPPLTEGFFTVTYTAVILEPSDAGGRFCVTFDTEAGVPEGRVHPSLRPLMVLCKGDRVTSNTKGASAVQVGIGKPFTVIMTCDLDKNIWSARVNGRKIADKVPFSEEFSLAYHERRVKGLEFGSIAGEDHQPTGKFVIADVKMETGKPE